MKENTNEEALDRFIHYQIEIRETLKSIEDKLTDRAAPEEIGWGHVTWIADLAKNLKELDDEF